MARPTKDNLDYYPMDVGFINDTKIKLLRADFGDKSLWVIISIFDLIYGDKGYYCDWNYDMCKILSLEHGGSSVCTPEYIKEVVQGCIKRSLFDEGVLMSFGKLTSKAIQRRYFKAKNDTFKKRIVNGNSLNINPDIFLLNEQDLDDIEMKGCFKTRNKYDKSNKNINNSTNNGSNSKNNDTKKSKVNKSNNIVPYDEIVEYLNTKIASRFKSTISKTQTLIKARYSEGFTIEDFKKVIDIKTSEWINDEIMRKYLRPETLFSNKFEGYLNQEEHEKVEDWKKNYD